MTRKQLALTLYVCNKLKEIWLQNPQDDWFDMKMRIHTVIWKIDTELTFMNVENTNFKYYKQWVVMINSPAFNEFIKKYFSDVLDTSEIINSHRLTQHEYNCIMAKRYNSINKK